MNVLFVGNSYTYYNDLEKLFEWLCRENGKDVSAFRVTSGGRKMLQYKDPEDTTTKQLKTALQERQYDVVFLQEQSLLPATDYDAFLDGMGYVTDMVRPQDPQLFLYATWARKEGSPDLEANCWTPKMMTELLYDAYRKAADALKATVSPVGLNFRKVIDAAPHIDLHDADLTHPSYAGSCLAALTHYHTLFGAFPENTGSLNLDEETLYVFKTVVCQ